MPNALLNDCREGSWLKGSGNYFCSFHCFKRPNAHSPNFQKENLHAFLKERGKLETRTFLQPKLWCIIHGGNRLRLTSLWAFFWLSCPLQALWGPVAYQSPSCNLRDTNVAGPKAGAVVVGTVPSKASTLQIRPHVMHLLLPIALLVGWFPKSHLSSPVQTMGSSPSGPYVEGICNVKLFISNFSFCLFLFACFHSEDLRKLQMRIHPIPRSRESVWGVLPLCRPYGHGFVLCLLVPQGHIQGPGQALRPMQTLRVSHPKVQAAAQLCRTKLPWEMLSDQSMLFQLPPLGKDGKVGKESYFTAMPAQSVIHLFILLWTPLLDD